MMYWHNLILLMMGTCCSKHVEAWNKYTEKTASSWSLTRKSHIINSFFFVFYLFRWCLPYRLPAIISQHIWIPFAAVSFSHLGYILMQPTPFSSEADPMFPWKKSTWDCRKWIFNDMLRPKARCEEGGSSTISTQIPDILFPKSRCRRFQKRPGLFCRQH